MPLHFSMRRLPCLALACAAVWLAGCEQLGIESAKALSDRREAEGKAVGGGCRHAARSIEQCYATNKRADKAAVFAGWREMEDYMRENKIEAVAPQGGVSADAGAKVEPPEATTKADDPAPADAVAKKPAKSKKQAS